jgi:hypothetical protein
MPSHGDIDAILSGGDYDTLLEKTVGELRDSTRIDRDTPTMTMKDWLLFGVAESVGAGVAVGSFLVGVALLPIGLVALALRRQ